MRYLALLFSCALLGGCAAAAMLPVAAVQATAGLVGGAVQMATAGAVAAGAAAAGGAAAGAASQAGGAAAAAPAAMPDPAPAVPLETAMTAPPASGPSDVAQLPEPGPAPMNPAALAPDGDDAEETAEDGSRRTERHNGNRSRSSGTSQCAHGPGYSACQQVDTTGMAVAAVAGAVIITSLFRDGEEVGSTCTLTCDDTEVSVSCPLPQEPLCQCGETPSAQCVTPQQDTAVAAAAPAEAPPPPPSRLRQQTGK